MVTLNYENAALCKMSGLMVVYHQDAIIEKISIYPSSGTLGKGCGGFDRVTKSSLLSHTCVYPIFVCFVKIRILYEGWLSKEVIKYNNAWWGAVAWVEILTV